MTLSIPEDLAKKMKILREIKWSVVARQAIQRKVDDMILTTEEKNLLDESYEHEKKGLLVSSKNVKKQLLSS